MFTLPSLYVEMHSFLSQKVLDLYHGDGIHLFFKKMASATFLCTYLSLRVGHFGNELKKEKPIKVLVKGGWGGGVGWWGGGGVRGSLARV